MATDLSRAIDEIEERVTAWRFRAGSVDVSPSAMLDELAQLLSEARKLVQQGSHAITNDASANDAALAARGRARRDEPWTELLREPYVLTDRFGTILAANSALYRLIGLPKYFTVGRPLAMFVPNGSRSELRAMITRLATSERESGNVSLRRYAGDPVPGHLSAMGSFEAGSITSISWVFEADRAPEPESSVDAAPLPGEHSNRRSAFLAGATGVLARSLDPELTLESLATLSVPLLGDWCLIDLLDEQGRLCRIAVAAAPRERHDQLRQLREREPATPGERTLAAEVISSARPAIMRDSLHGFPHPLALCAAELSVFQELGVTSALMTPLRARGTVLGVITWLMSGARRRHTDADLLLAEELGNRVGILADNARLYRQSQQASRAKSDFLAAMSHELRTPLTAVIGYTEILADEIVGPLTALQKEQLSRIRASSEHLVVLVDEVLTYARLEAGHEELVWEEVDVHDLVDQALTIVAVQAKVRHLELITDLPDERVAFWSDRSRLRQILVNLLANAVKFTRVGRVGVRAAVDGDAIVFTVWDTGIGIAPEHVEQIFAPFWQVDQQATRSFGGSGLGLAVVRRLARLLGGDVAVRSVRGEGSEFTVRLPLRSGEADGIDGVSSDGRPSGDRADPS